MATIQGIYVALFGRPADPAGLAYFNEQTNNGADLTAIGDLASTDEYQARFENLNNVQIVTKIYQDLFGRDPDAAGLAFFVAALNTGSQSINTIAINILDGAQGDDALVVANKVEAANLFTAEIDTAIEVGSYVGDDAADLGRAYLSIVTADDASVPTQEEAAEAVQGVVDAGVAGNVINLATGADLAVGAGAADATNDNDTVTVDPVGGYDASAEINTGLGNDRVNITLTSSQVLTATSLVGVERLYVDSTGAFSLEVQEAEGIQQLWASGTTGADVDFQNIEDTGIVGGVEGTNGAVYFDYDTDADDDAATIVVDGDATSVFVDEIEALTVNVGGVSDLGNFGASDAATITITGTGDLTFTLDGIDASSDDHGVIDASAHVGKLNIDTNGYYDIDVIGGAQNDTFTVAGDSEGVNLTGGAGSDLIVIDALTNLNAAADIEDDLISITDFDGAADTLDLTLTGSEVELNNVQASNVAAAADLAAAFAVVDTAIGANNHTIFTYEGSTYIYQNDADATFNGGEGAVELVGFTGELNASNFI